MRLLAERAPVIETRRSEHQEERAWERAAGLKQVLSHLMYCTSYVHRSKGQTGIKRRRGFANEVEDSGEWILCCESISESLQCTQISYLQIDSS